MKTEIDQRLRTDDAASAATAMYDNRIISVRNARNPVSQLRARTQQSTWNAVTLVFFGSARVEQQEGVSLLPLLMQVNTMFLH